MFDSSMFIKKMWALKKWCVTEVAHCMASPCSYTAAFVLDLLEIPKGRLLMMKFIPQRLYITILLDFSLSAKAAPHECVIRTSQP